MRLFSTIFISCCVWQLITSLEIEEQHYRKKRQLDWNNGFDYQFDHMAVSSMRHIRREDDGNEESHKLSGAEASGANTPEGVPGEPGVDYPILPSIPLTNFHCRGRVPGYYGDTETACQVFHVCDVSGRQDSFLCPNGTIFSQKLFSCDWWYNVQCAVTRQHYELNRNLFKGSETNVYGTPSFWNWLSEVDDEEPDTQRNGPARPGDNDEDAIEPIQEVPAVQPLVSRPPPYVPKQRNVQSASLAPATPRPVTTSTQRPVIAGGWEPVVSTRLSTTPTPALVNQQIDAAARKRSAPKSTLRPETVAATPSGDDWWNTGFMRDYRMPNFGWARENLFPTDQGTTPELAWMDIGPNGPLMNHPKHSTKPTSGPTAAAQQDRRQQVKQTSRQSIQPNPVQQIKPIQQAPKKIQQYKVQAQVVQQRPAVQQQQAKTFQQLPNSDYVAHAPKSANRQPTKASKPRPITTAKPTKSTTTISAHFDYFNDDDSTFDNDAPTSTLKTQNPVTVKTTKSSSNKKRLATSASIASIPPAKTQPSTQKLSNAQKLQVKTGNSWSQQANVRSQPAVQKPTSRVSNVKTSSLQTARQTNVKRGNPIYQPTAAVAEVSRRRDPFVGVVMERVSAPFRPSMPISIAPSPTARQLTSRPFTIPTEAPRSSRQMKKKKSRSPNAYDPRLDRPYRQEHPIWKMLNWESTRM